MRRGIGLISAFLLLLVPACARPGDDDKGGFDSVFAEIEDLTGEARERKLLELARQEGGELSLYSSMSLSHLDAVEDAFEEEFDIDLSFYRANSETIVPRLSEEAKANFHGADVVRVNGLAMINLNQEGILVSYTSPSQRDLVDGTAYDGWTIDNFSTFVLTWNTNLVAEGDRPKSWEALADPRWKGVVAIEAGDVNWYKELWEHWVKTEGKSPEDADRLFEAIARNASVVRGHTLLGQLMAAGEFALAPNYASSVNRLRDQGAPIGWEPAVEPIFPEGQGVGLVDGARNPAAAILFIDWLLSDGQEVLQENYGESARKDLATAPGADRRVIDFKSLAADQERWTERFERLLTLGKEVERSG